PPGRQPPPPRTHARQAHGRRHPPRPARRGHRRVARVLCRPRPAVLLSGKPGAGPALYEVTDARIQAAQWAATTASCSGEAFNITNGDVVRWCNLWSSFANFLSLGFAEPRRISLTDF